MNHSDKKPDRQSGRPAELEGGLPEQIGPYRVLEVLGEGGMGTVYLAQQEQPFRRRVALKIIKLGMDTKEVIARFESERQALALMNHPNIAKVFDADTTEQGRPYFVMEHVAGIPITKYCDQHRLGIRARLELFGQVCQAIHHAHQKGIIHRDIKPSNVLVAVAEGQAVPKVIDFGVAKATHQRLTDKTVFTQQGSSIGTPEYMSPEQAESGGLDVDTTTDIYSLGVVLYELLVGVVPFKFLLAGFDTTLRTIREKEPPRLSTRLTSLGEKAGKMAERRHTDLRSLSRQLKGELDWITQKAMEKDRTRRYQSASELGADVERYLKREAVSASPPSAVYHLRKFAMRNKGPVVAVMTVIVLLAGFAVAMAIQANRIAQEAATAEQVSAFMVDLFTVSIPDEARGNTITAREILDKGAEKIEQELQQQPVVQARLMDTMGKVYRTLGLYEQSGLLLEQALKLRERELGPEHPDVALSLHNLGDTYWTQGKYAQAEPLLQRALAIRERALGPGHREVARTLNLLGILYLDQGQYVQAEPLLLRSLAIREKSDHRWVPTSLSNLAYLYFVQGNYAQAEPLYLRSIAVGEKTLGPEHPQVAYPVSNLAELYTEQGKYAEAESLFLRALTIREKALGLEHTEVAVTLNDMAKLYAKQGKTSQAESAFQRALAIREKALPPEHPRLAETLSDYAAFLRKLGRGGEADKLEARAQAIKSKPGQ